MGAGPPLARRALQLRVRAFPPELVKGWKYGMQVTEARGQNVGGTVGPRSSVVAGPSSESQANFFDDESAGRCQESGVDSLSGRGVWALCILEGGIGCGGAWACGDGAEGDERG